MSRADRQVNFRIPAPTLERLAAAATGNGRSVNSEIVHRLTGAQDVPNLRDQFAIAALPGLIYSGYDKQECAVLAYATADAMLAERSKP